MTHVTRTRHFLTVFPLLGIIILLMILIWFFETSHTNVVIDTTELTKNVATDNFLQEEEMVVIDNNEEEPTILPIQKLLFEYVEIRDSCGVHFDGDCVVARSGPGLDFPVVLSLRNGIVLKVGGKVDHDGHVWYKIIFDEFIRYPERIHGDMYVAADYVDVLLDEGDKTVWENGSTTTTKTITVNRKEQKLYAFDGNELFMEIAISTGLELSPTPAGTFTVFKKTPSRYMQGPLPGFTDTYDLPGVPWNLYFTHDGAVIHGAYWHDSFGSRYSHGCVNLPPVEARKLYNWAELGTNVIVK